MRPAGPAETQGRLAGARVLVVEDDFIILSGAGGPANRSRGGGSLFRGPFGTLL
jgi:hypothetical protein